MPTLTPKVSVIVPVYNVESYIRECLDSLVAQTLHDIEIICVDDCGSDASMSIVEEYAAKDSRVRILRHEKNSGLSAARNTGMAAAEAPYIMFCDSDDFFELDACEKMHAALETSPSINIAICGARILYEVECDSAIQFSIDSHYIDRYEGVKKLSAGILRNTPVITPNKIFKRSFLETYNILFPKGLLYEDVYFFNVCAAHAQKVYFVKEILYNYRSRAGSIMRRTEMNHAELALDHLQISMRLWDYYKDNNFCRLWNGYIIELFAKYLGVTIGYCGKNKNSQMQIRQILSRFIQREGFDSKNLPQKIARQIMQYLPTKRKYVFGIIKIRESLWIKRVYFCGIRVWKGANRLEILRDAFYGKLHEKYHAPRCVYAVDDAQLLSELQALGRFTYIPGSGNMEDAAVAAASLRFFEDHHLPYTLYSEQEECIDTIVFGGDGSLWNQEYGQKMRQKGIYEILRHAKKVVILPISVSNCPELLDIIDERYVVFCREKRSYDMLVAAGTNARIMLDHDMSLHSRGGYVQSTYNKKIDYRSFCEYLFDWTYMPEASEGYFMRTDYRTAVQGDAQGLDIADYKWYQEVNSKDEVCFSTEFMYTMISAYDRIITDRLQIGIAAALMGKDVYLINDLAGINSDVYQHSMKNLRNVRFVDDIPEFDSPCTVSSENKPYFQELRALCMEMRESRVRSSLRALNKSK